ncbi:MAG: tRNA (adenosine(37)-N6)-dimethylallyltransferase MiaA [Bryobacterales bacterium]|nr:tRNA (adenosine(37)-N6)-dimethylallyltransferase MiaA [Bryobacterales bacterium]
MPAGRPLVAIVGPTGSGKSELALRVASELNGEVVNCDSLQLYRYFDIGTAKLTPAERRGVPHHLLDTVEPDQHYSAGEYVRSATAVLADITARGRLPLVAGGTGFYLRALVDGLFPGPHRDEALRARLSLRSKRRPGSLHRLLRRFDPASAVRIHPNDVPKVIRALEVRLLTRGSLSAAFAGGREGLRGYRALKIGLSPPRDLLFSRLDERCRRMFETGLVGEVRRILWLGFPPAARPLGSHGYRQALQYLRGEIGLEEAVYQAQRNTRRYAKRQWTWFRQEKNLEWFSGFGYEPALQEAVLDRVREHLAAN